MRTLVFTLVLCLVAFGSVARGQEQTRRQEQTADEVIRVNTELVQTSVMVFDKQGRFVDGLKPEQFELRVDDTVVPINFFERVVAGSAEEEAQLRALSRSGPDAPKESIARHVSTRGRIVFFFIDDLHLSLDSLGRTRAAISHFIENEMGPKDWVAIASASGQIGFLQQLTDNKAVLRAALARLQHVPYTVHDTEQPTMSEYMALKIEQKDRDALGYYIERCLHDNRVYTAAKCFEVVQDRSRMIIQQAAAVTANTLQSLERLIRMTGNLSGRKLVLLISDGFFLGARNRYANAFDRLPQITDEARRHGSVIYTIDARGLISGQPDATVGLVDGNGLLDRANLGEIPASQDALHALAGDTGGRALRNSNSITDWVTDSLKETSNYYLLAWRPADASQRANKFKRISVKVIGRPELSVRLPRSYLESITRPAAEANNPKPSRKAGTLDTTLQAAVGEPPATSGDTNAQQRLPTLLALAFLDTPQNGPVLTTSTQIATNSLNYGVDNRQTATIDLAGVVFDVDGKQSASFSTRLNVNSLSSNTANADDDGVIYNHRSTLAPGLYQVRVAARDVRSGRAGSAMQWIEIPNLKVQGLSLSSLLVGVQPVGETQKVSAARGAEPSVQFSVSRRFKRSARLGFLLFIYNASRATGESRTASLTTQVQVFDSQGRAVIQTQASPLRTTAADDAARIPYAGSFSLESLAPDQYMLRVVVTNQTTKTSSTQQVNFTVE